MALVLLEQFLTEKTVRTRYVTVRGNQWKYTMISADNEKLTVIIESDFGFSIDNIINEIRLGIIRLRGVILYAWN